MDNVVVRLPFKPRLVPAKSEDLAEIPPDKVRSYLNLFYEMFLDDYGEEAAVSWLALKKSNLERRR